MKTEALLKALPSIEKALSLPGVAELAAAYPRELVTEWARAAVEELREELAAGVELSLGDDGKLEPGLVAERVREQARDLLTPSLRRVINATGIVIHTNLGRAPLSPRLVQAMTGLAAAYCNLEYELDSGSRGSRHVHLERLIQTLTGAETGFVVNNNAAAVLVALNTLARAREVVVSRGELIEIGGSFRMPDIIQSGGARIREVGSTNKTRLSDYEKAIGPDTGLLLKVHPSNFRIQGFTEETSLPELVELGKKHHLPVMVDLGSGLLIDLETHGLRGERPVRWYVEQGPDVVTFSGDKLLGGPQAGFIVGHLPAVAAIKKNPMVRALRVGKLTIAALESLLISYLGRGSLPDRAPALGLLVRPAGQLRTAARRLAAALAKEWPEAELRVEPDQAFAGGGSLPVQPLPTWVVAVAVPGRSGDDLARAFRLAQPPVVGRIRSGVFCLDLRTVLPGEAAQILAGARSLRAPG